MQKLVEGIHAFQREHFGEKRELFERLAGGQAPEALFITCSDSRINPNLITQTEPGELFVLRNAGNIVPPHGPSPGGEAATIEYAVSALGIRDIIVCGHSGCGAMAGLLDPSSLDALPAVKGWLGNAQATARIVQEKYPHAEGKARQMIAVSENVLVQLEHLRTLPSVAAAIARGLLKLHGWVYKFETGQIFAFDAAKGQFEAIGEDGSEGVALHGSPTLRPMRLVEEGRGA